ncbi:MAG: TRAP transporter small permease subunit, partial [Spirochaetales bacterium]|nr:TRAP transporter small permease subunit [Spirochaetales bacterium]
MQKVIDRIVAVAATASFVVMILVVLLQIVSRYLFPISIHWTEEAARFSFLYTVAFAAGLAMRDKSYVNVDLIPRILRGRARVVLEAILDGATIVFLWVVAWH